ncbi:hypothetical protein BDR07DRAFT_1389462 [Suillus spraguei]|nr:hypothetical protein BDR07DRAFT_1389462 [Suillus spraguei]
MENMTASGVTPASLGGNPEVFVTKRFRALGYGRGSVSPSRVGVLRYYKIKLWASLHLLYRCT